MAAPLIIVALTGGRDFVPSEGDEERLLDFLSCSKASIVRHGGCRGADTWAGLVAHRAGYVVEVWPATRRDADRWYDRSDYARIVMPPASATWPSAGPRRNRAMLEGNGYRALALGTLPGGTGTRRCRESAAELGTLVTKIS